MARALVLNLLITARNDLHGVITRTNGGEMANPMEKRAPAVSAVASCTATDCTYNENRECHAGEIHVEMGANGAVCGTYQPRRPKARP